MEYYYKLILRSIKYASTSRKVKNRMGAIGNFPLLNLTFIILVLAKSKEFQSKE